MKLATYARYVNTYRDSDGVFATNKSRQSSYVLETIQDLQYLIYHRFNIINLPLVLVIALPISNYVRHFLFEFELNTTHTQRRQIFGLGLGV